MIAKRTGRFESFDGTEIYYEIRGSGLPIVLSYGLACQFNHWIHQTQHFSKSYQVILFDYRGHHRSGMPEDPANLTIEAIAKDVKGLMDHLSIPRASFFGHSFGVPVLLKAFDLYPELFANVVFINGFATNPIRGALDSFLSRHAFDTVRTVHQRHPKWTQRAWRMALLNPLTIPISALSGGFNLSLTAFKDIEIYSKGVSLVDLNVFVTLFEDMMKFDGTPVLSRMSIPVLLVSGTKDSVTPKDYQEFLYQQLPKSELLRVPYGSHCTHLDLPEFVNLRIDQFFRAHGFAPVSK